MSDKEPKNDKPADDASPDVESLKKENEQLRSENERLREEGGGIKAKLEEALANLATAEHARDQYKEGFETQQKAHEDAMRAIEELKKPKPILLDQNGPDTRTV